jgi:hypothetical protein
MGFELYFLNTLLIIEYELITLEVGAGAVRLKTQAPSVASFDWSTLLEGFSLCRSMQAHLPPSCLH